MTRLELVTRLAEECGAVAPDTTINQTGEDLRFVNWVDQAWSEIQSKRQDWRWMRSSNILGHGISFTTISGQVSYELGTDPGDVGVLPDNFTSWVQHSFRNYTTATGVSSEIFMDHIGFDAWRDGYMYGAMRSVRTRPVAIAIGPNNELCLGPPPTADYTITGDYYMAPSAMAADDDTPTGLPQQFHMAIVYLAMTYYGRFESAPEVLDAGQAGYGTLVRRLQSIQAQTVHAGGPLA